MKLFLASMSVQPETAKAFLKLVGKPAGEVKLAFIPTAADQYENKWFVEATRNDLRRLGIKELIDIDLTQYTPEGLRLALADCDVIFVNGGNTFYLLDWVRKSGFDIVLPELLARGVVYAGTSAGSIIVGPNIELAGYGPSGDPNDINLTDLTGLGLVDFAVWPHLTEQEREHVLAGAKTVVYPVAAISDTQVIVLDGEELALVGPGSKLLLNGFNTACPTCDDNGACKWQ